MAEREVRFRAEEAADCGDADVRAHVSGVFPESAGAGAAAGAAAGGVDCGGDEGGVDGDSGGAEEDGRDV